MYGEEYDVDEDKSVPEGTNEIYISRLLNHFNETYEKVKSLNEILKNLVLQLNGLYNKNYKEYQNCFKRILLIHAFDILGELLVGSGLIKR